MATTNSEYQAQAGAQSPQGQYTPSSANTIPLVCLICPKTSNFSDLSHLLTHISSKGHLHNVFQCGLNRDVDPKAESALEEYETWYQQNNISALLRARKSAREQRDSQQRQSQVSSDQGVDNAAAQHQGNRGGRSGRRGRGNLKTESRSRAGIDVLHDDSSMKFESEENDVAQHGPGYRSANHNSYIWHHDSIYQNDPNQYSNTPGGQFQDYLEDEDDSSKYEASELYSPFRPEDTPETVEDDTGALILKGVVYPGMGGFDSATERDRRMRNQKKDPAVLLKLETSSQLVTKVEEVLDLNLNYQRSRDVYDEPSIYGSEDEDDISIDQARTKSRINQAKPSYMSAKRRANGRSRQQARPAGRTRATRSSARKTRGLLRSTAEHLSVTPRRITRSSAGRQEQLPLHNHGVHPDVRTMHDCSGDIDDSEGSEIYHGLIGQCLITPWQVFEPMFLPRSEETSPSPETYLSPGTCDDSTRRHEHLHGLALRPGNPNASFASPTLAFKKSPPHYSGKENNHLLIKSPSSSFNPYLHPSGDSIETGSYNPLCPQSADGFSYRLYSPYEDEHKSTTSSSFNPINNNSAYDSAHVAGVANNSYHHNQPGGDDYPL
ncbi:hypothetical protein F4861DRAFT_551982 [Xylaria intraflava]|nr:hypothetical protein F4861DRAFT_551982 [Xylaria intraflava]